MLTATAQESLVPISSSPVVCSPKVTIAAVGRAGRGTAGVPIGQIVWFTRPKEGQKRPLASLMIKAGSKDDVGGISSGSWVIHRFITSTESKISWQIVLLGCLYLYSPLL